MSVKSVLIYKIAKNKKNTALSGGSRQAVFLCTKHDWGFGAVMLKACQYCGKLHRYGETCPFKPMHRSKRGTTIERFRSTQAWQRKRADIQRRDLHLCRLCAIGYGGKPYTFNPDVQVHHIVPMSDDWDSRLDSDNLICLCPYHHELAECGKIPRDYLRELAVAPVPKEFA